MGGEARSELAGVARADPLLTTLASARQPARPAARQIRNGYNRAGDPPTTAITAARAVAAPVAMGPAATIHRRINKIHGDKSHNSP
jgi:hypothetical protein